MKQTENAYDRLKRILDGANVPVVILTYVNYEDDPEWGFCVVYPPISKKSEGIGVVIQSPAMAQKKGIFDFSVTHINDDEYSGFPNGAWTGSTLYYRAEANKFQPLLELLCAPMTLISTNLNGVEPDEEWAQKHGIKPMPSKVAEVFGSEFLDLEASNA